MTDGMASGPGLVVTGASGRMGRTLVGLIAAEGSGARLAGAVERAGHPWIGRDVGEAMGGAPLGVRVTDDPLEAFARAQVVIDFTSPAATVEFAGLAAQARGMPSGGALPPGRTVLERGERWRIGWRTR